MKNLFFGLTCFFLSYLGAVQPVVILGGGVGAMSASLYLGRAGVKALVIEGSTPGGLLMQSHNVQNWPGIDGIPGWELIERMHSQAVENGAKFLAEEVVSVDFSKKPYSIKTKKVIGEGTQTYQADNVIIAMGTKNRYLDIPGERTYWGKGISNCAVCDGSLYKGKKVVVVGGGDAAVLEAEYLSRIASDVTIVVRKEAFRAVEEKRRDQLLAKENVKVLFGTKVTKVHGTKDAVTELTIEERGKSKQLKADGLFLAIGSDPNTEIFRGQLELDARGYIVLKDDQQTSVPGVYAVGDIVDPIYKQAVSAAGDGAKAALQAIKNLNTKEEVVATHELIEITSSEQFYQELANSDRPVVVDFYATWCGPCKKLDPLYRAWSQKVGHRLKFLKVNVDTVEGLTGKFGIRSMPTVLVLDRSGKELERHLGANQIVQFFSQLESNPEPSVN